MTGKNDPNFTTIRVLKSDCEKLEILRRKTGCTSMAQLLNLWVAIVKIPDIRLNLEKKEE